MPLPFIIIIIAIATTWFGELAHGALVFDIAPTFGPYTGGTLVTMHYTGIPVNYTFSKVSCQFDTYVTPANYTLLDTTGGRSDEVACFSPSILTPRDTSLSLLLDSTVYTFPNSIIFSYYGITTISPVAGQEYTATVVTIVVTNLKGPTVSPGCRFADVAVAANEVSPGRLLCTSPDFWNARILILEVMVNAESPEWTNEKRTFEYYVSPSLSILSVSLGPFLGSTVITLTGSNFKSYLGLTCKFGDLVTTQAAYLNSTAIVCTSPSYCPGTWITCPRETPNREYCKPTLNHCYQNSLAMDPISTYVELHVSLNGQSYTDQFLNFEYYTDPVILSLIPSVGRLQGGTAVTVSGMAFNVYDVGFCRFGVGIIVAATTSDTNTLMCQSPPSVVYINSPLGITFNGQQYSANPNVTFGYFGLADIVPKFGASAGNTVITIMGPNIARGKVYGQSKCWMNSQPVNAVWVGDTMTCASLSNPLGVVNFTISLYGDEISSETMQFQYVPTSAVTSLYPSVGPIAGGYYINAFGQNFQQSSLLQCIFDFPTLRIRSDQFVFYNSSFITCKVPASNLSGRVLVSVSSNGQDQSPSAVTFIFFGVSSFLPYGGPDSGGTVVSVTMSQVLPSAFCKFGNTSMVSAILNGGLVIQCITPANLTVGNTSLTVSADGINFSDKTPTFIVYATPFVRKLDDPASGPTTGGSVVNVQGINYLPYGFGIDRIVTCKFIETTNLTTISIVLATFSSNSRLQCISPPSTSAQPLTFYVEISMNQQQYTNDQQPFYHYEIRNLSPAMGPESGGTFVYISGINLGHGSNQNNEIQCRFWIDIDLKGSFFPLNASDPTGPGTVRCLTPSLPSGLVGQYIGIRVTLNLQVANEFSAVQLQFQYFKAPTISNMEPTFDTMLGGRNVNITGTNFFPVPQLACMIGGVIVPGAFLTSTSISCVAPQVNVPSRLPVQISLNGQQYLATLARFSYYGISSIFPIAGLTAGNSEIDVIGSYFDSTPSTPVCGFFWLNGSIISIAPAAVPVSGGGSLATCNVPPSPIGQPVTIRVEISLTGGNKFTNSTSTFTYYFAASPTKIAPSAGPMTGQTVVSVIGSGFPVNSTTSRCKFGASTVAVATPISSTLMLCTTPVPSQNVQHGQVAFLFSLNARDFENDNIMFAFAAVPKLQYITPQYGPTLAVSAKMVTVFGENFENVTTLTCRFGKYIARSVVFLDSQTVLCQPPSVPAPGVLNLDVSVDGEQFQSSTDNSASLQFRFFGLTKITPSLGPTAGATSVILNGTLLSAPLSFVLWCRFTSNLVSIKVAAIAYDDNSVGCSSPRLPQDVYQVGFSMLRDEYTSDAITFKTYDSAKLASLAPSIGVAQGGYPVTVTGSGFVNSSFLSCKFTNILGQGAIFVSSTQIVCIVPNLVVTTLFQVQISLNGQQFEADSVGFQSFAPIILKSIYPSGSPSSGNVTVTISGMNIANFQTWCLFKNSGITYPLVQATFFSTTNKIWLECPSPANISLNAVLQVSVSLDGKLFSNSLPFYCYQIFNTVVPTSGVSTGATQVLVMGSNMHPCLHSGCIPTSLDPIVEVGLKQRYPNCPPCPLGVPRDYICKFISPSGMRLTVGSWDFPDDGLICPSPAESSLLYPNMTVVAVMDVSVYGGTNGSLSTDPRTYTSNAVNFTYYYQPVVLTVFPTLGSAAGGTLVNVTGLYFQNVPGLSCRFHYTLQPVNATFVNSKNILCQTPPVCFLGSFSDACDSGSSGIPVVPLLPEQRADTAVEVALNWQQFTSNNVLFAFFAVTGFLPFGGLREGNTLVEIAGVNLDKSTVQPMCMFKYVPVNGTFIPQYGVIQCLSPTFLDAHEFLEVSLSPDRIYTADRHLFFYYTATPPLLILPNSGPTSGSKEIRIALLTDTWDSDADFRDYFPTPSGGSGLYCIFGEQRTPATVVGPKSMKCLSASQTAAIVPFQISLNNIQISKTLYNFTYYTISSLEPSGVAFSCGSVQTCYPFVPTTDTTYGPSAVAITIYGIDFFNDFTNNVPGYPKGILCKYNLISPFAIKGTDIGRFNATDNTIICPISFSIVEVLNQTMPTLSLQVQVALNGRDFSEEVPPKVLALYMNPVVAHIYPPICPAGSCGPIGLYGNGFTNYTRYPMTCRFLPLVMYDPVPAVVYNDSYAVCQPPKIPSRCTEIDGGCSVNNLALKVQFSGNNLQYSDVGVSLFYFAVADRVGDPLCPGDQGRCINPSIIPVKSTTVFTIIGYNFEAIASQVIPSKCIFNSTTNGYSENTTVSFTQHGSDTVLTCPAPSPLFPVGKAYLGFNLNGMQISNDTADWVQFHVPWNITDYFPKGGSFSGGTVITVIGQNFFPIVSAQCVFGLDLTYATVINSTHLYCTTPPQGSGASSRQVCVTLNGGLDKFCMRKCTNTINSCPLEFYFFKAPRIESFKLGSADSGPDRGGTTIVLVGTLDVFWDTQRAGGAGQFGQLDTSFKCRLTAIHMPLKTVREFKAIMVMDPSNLDLSIQCVTPPGMGIGQNQIDVTVNDQEYYAPGILFYIFREMNIQNVFPESIRTSTKGQVVTITGFNFGDTQVPHVDKLFQADFVGCGLVPSCAVPVSVMSDDLILAVAPTVDFPVTVSIRATMNGFQWSSSNLKMNYELTSSTDCVEGCRGRGTCALGICQCIRPWDGLDCSTFFAMTRMYPRAGPHRGGTLVTIQGYRFDSGDPSAMMAAVQAGSSAFQCKFGNQTTAGCFDGTNKIYCYSPPMFLNGSVNVEVSVDGGSHWTVNGYNYEFHYYEIPQIQTISPLLGPSTTTDGLPTKLIVSSILQYDLVANPRDYSGCFQDLDCLYLAHQQQVGLGCMLGTQVSLDATLLSLNLMECAIPSSPIPISAFQQVQVPVYVTINGYDYTNSSLTFTYYAPPIISRIVPDVGPDIGGTVITLFGSSFLNSSYANCRFGQLGLYGAYTYFNATMAFCTSPAITNRADFIIASKYLNSIDAILDITLNNQDYTASGVVFTYVAMWQLVLPYFFPTTGPETGGVLIRVQGNGFWQRPTTSCKFGDIVVMRRDDPNAVLITKSADIGGTDQVICTAPMHLIPKPVYSYDGVCDGTLIPGTWRGLCLPPEYTCQWKLIDQTTQELYCILGSSAASKVLMPPPANSAGLPLEAMPNGDQILGPDYPLRLRVPIAISIDSQHWASTAAQLFTFYEITNVTLLLPDVGPITGGTIVTVIGQGFANQGGLGCYFGRFFAPATFVNTHTVLCLAPNVIYTQNPLDMGNNYAVPVPLEVSLSSQGGDRAKSVSGVPFFFTNLWRVDHMRPVRAPVTGGANITITGPFFHYTPVIRCKFGDVDAYKIYVLSNTTMVCVTPSVPEPAVVNLTLSLDGYHYSVGASRLAVGENGTTEFEHTAVRDLYTWGDNQYFEVGKLTQSPQLSPMLLDAIKSHNVSSIVFGATHALAVAFDITRHPVKRVVFSWGDNLDGQLGLGDSGKAASRQLPTIAVCGGGLNSNCTRTPCTSAGDLMTIQDPLYHYEVESVGAGFYHSFAVTTDGTLWAWGSNARGVLGLGSFFTDDKACVPTAVDFFVRNGIAIAEATGGMYHSMALSRDGRVFAWGSNLKGQLGLGDMLPRLFPAQLQVTNSDGVILSAKQIAAGRYFSMLLTQDGNVWTWGINNYGQLGQCLAGLNSDLVSCVPLPRTNIDSEVIITVPTVVLMIAAIRGRTPIVQIAAGTEHAAVISARGDVFVWGSNQHGQLGPNKASILLLPDSIPELRIPDSACTAQDTGLRDCLDATSLERFGRLAIKASAGFDYTLVALIRGEPLGQYGSKMPMSQIFALGGNSVGQLGVGDVVTQHTKPVLIGGAGMGVGLYDVVASSGSVSALTQTCSPGEGNLCSSNGICLEDGTCLCYHGWRGPDCSVPCTGGINNICDGRGAAAPAYAMSVTIQTLLPIFLGTQMSLIASRHQGNQTAQLLLGWLDGLIASQPLTKDFILYLITQERDLQHRDNRTLTDDQVVGMLQRMQQGLLDYTTLALAFGTRPVEAEAVFRSVGMQCAACSFERVSWEVEMSAANVQEAWLSWSPNPAAVVSVDGPITGPKVNNSRVMIQYQCPLCSLASPTDGCLFDSSCVCKKGFSKFDCSGSCNLVNGVPCAGHGTCLDSGACLCDPGWVGVNCTVECSGGASNPCSYNGNCTSTGELYVSNGCVPGAGRCLGECRCDPGFVGDACGYSCPGPKTNPCNGNGACMVLGGVGTCQCKQGYFGTACDVQCKGKGSPCSSHGTCIKQPSAQYKLGDCVCFDGFVGENCDVECGNGAKHPCNDVGICIKNGTSLGQCLCLAVGADNQFHDIGWRGDNCTLECSGGALNPCNGHGACLDDASCQCNPGYKGKSCQVTCKGAPLTTCSGVGECQDDGSCLCPFQYRGDSCQFTCPGLPGPICSAKGICNDQGTCDCQSRYAGTNCDKYAIWVLAITAITVTGAVGFLVFLGYKFWKLRRKRVRRARRERRKQNKKEDDEDEEFPQKPEEISAPPEKIKAKEDFQFEDLDDKKTPGYVEDTYDDDEDHHGYSFDNDDDDTTKEKKKHHQQNNNNNNKEKEIDLSMDDMGEMY